MNTLKMGLLKLARTPFNSRFVEALFRRLTLDRNYGTFITRVPPKHVHYPKPSMRETDVHGIRFRLDISELVAWFVYWGFRDPPRQRLYSLIEKGDVVIDIGANLGDVALHAARRVSTTGRVYAFEPFPANFAKLQVNAALNSFDNLTIENLGLGSEKQKIEMFVADQLNEGMNRMLPNQSVAANLSTTQVDVVRLDDYVHDNGIEKIDLIKIDVEGFEKNVLLGASETLSKHRPRLFVEAIDDYLRDQGSSTKDVVEYLGSFGYDLTYAVSGEAIDPNTSFAGTQFDIVALPRS